MLSFFQNFTWSSECDWEGMKKWQNTQQSLHFEKSSILQYYILTHPDFSTACSDAPLKYCFGDFASLITNYQHLPLIKKLELLVDIYDTCKGYRRRCVGDPYHISNIRSAVENRSLLNIKIYSDCLYNYDIIHAHTLACYSLSTLLIRLAYHILSHSITKFPMINRLKCQKSYNSMIFITNETMPHISTLKLVTPTEIKNLPAFVGCKICGEEPNKIYGEISVCQKCYKNLICSVCSRPTDTIGNDNLPKCYYHL